MDVPAGKKVAGQAIDEHGRSITNKPVANGSDQQLIDNTATLKDAQINGRRGPRWTQIDTPRSHVEGHFAALLRQPDGPNEITLIVTREPCVDEPFGCDRILEAIIPAGKKLHVFIGGNGQEPRWHKTYTGNGTGVRTP